MPAFVPGSELSRLFFLDVVQPDLEAAFPGVPYAAGLLGSGSEVLGFDTEMSTDHDWGPRVDIYVGDDASGDLTGAIRAAMDQTIPAVFHGWPTRFVAAQEGQTPIPAIGVSSPAAFLESYLGLDTPRSIAPADWLTLPTQKLRTIASGPIHHDAIGLTELRAAFAWYPHDVWLYLLAAGWTRVAQEEHLMGRAGHAGDDIGSALIAGRLVRDLMRLAFLMEREYAPYPKWFGTAFRQLACAPALSPHLSGVLRASTWTERQAHLIPAYEAVAAMHNTLALTPPLVTSVRPFFSRPFASIAQNGFAESLVDAITDPRVRQLTERPLIGSIDLISDNTDLLEQPTWRARLRTLYD